jgi:hypothetical protein
VPPDTFHSSHSPSVFLNTPPPDIEPDSDFTTTWSRLVNTES